MSVSNRSSKPCGTMFQSKADETNLCTQIGETCWTYQYLYIFFTFLVSTPWVKSYERLLEAIVLIM